MVRWQELLKTDSVAKQDTDEKIRTYQANKAMVDSGRANVKRLEDLVSFEKVYAPFDGVITARNIDVGALINAGNSGVSRQLFVLAATDASPRIRERSADLFACGAARCGRATYSYRISKPAFFG